MQNNLNNQNSNNRSNNQTNTFRKNNRNSRNNKFQKNNDSEKPKSEFESHVIQTKRVTKVVKSGKRMRFSAAVVVGNKKGKVGFAVSKGLDPRSAIEKATRKATQNAFKINLDKGTIPFGIEQKFKSANIFLKPAQPGTGLIVSNAIRPILELAGVSDIYTKIYGTTNKLTNAYCIVEGLKNFAKNPS